MMRIATSLVLCIFVSAASLGAQKLQTTTLESKGKKTSYRWLEMLPPKHEAKKPFPVFICLPPGDGSKTMAGFAMDAIGKEAAKRGHIVISPIADRGILTGKRASEVFVMLEALAKRYRLDEKNIVLSGLSNGGRGAFDVAALHPNRFRAVMLLPGAAAKDAEFDKFKGVPFFVRVGEKDEAGWREASDHTVKGLRKSKAIVDFEVVASQGHVLRIDHEKAFKWLSEQADRQRDSVELKFPSKDGLPITAEFYSAGWDKSMPYILLCHQAGSSRGEYKSIAPRLVKAGFHCLAIDQRSGRGMNGVSNKTAAAASEKKQRPSYLDARQDIEAALAWIRAKGYSGKLSLWGSSYSASLTLVIGAEHKELAALLSFSPGEYLGKPHMVRNAAAAINIPSLIVAPEGERRSATLIFDAIKHKKKKLLCGKGIKHG